MRSLDFHGGIVQNAEGFAHAIHAIFNEIVSQVGLENTESLLSTSLPAWYNGDDALYHQAVKTELFEDMEDGRHVVFGVSLHNSYTNQYGIFSAYDWPAGICLPGDPCWRPCETFWITPECFATSLRSNIRIFEEEPPFLNNNSIPVLELFQNRGLLIFGSAGVAWHTTTHEVVTLLAEKLLIEDPVTGHAKPIGTLWKEIYSEIKGSHSIEPKGLSSYGIFGDPMLFVRGVYDSATPAEDTILGPLAFQSTPNPFNGQIQFQISGLKPGGGSARIYDIRGMHIKTEKLPPQSGTAVVIWKAKNEQDEDVPSGIYFVVVANQGQKVTRKIAYIK